MKTWLATLALGVSCMAHGDALQDRFATVWESLWYQGGSPTSVFRWDGEIRVHIHGRNKQMHRARVMAALGKVSTLAGMRLLDVSDAPEAARNANLDVEIVGNDDLPDNQACFVRYLEVARSRIRQAELKMRDHAVYDCVLHEAMHVMGIVGHPTGDTVLSYFYQRVDALTALDALMVRAWYSPQMRPGMTPFSAAVVLTDAVVAAHDGNAEQASEARNRFLQGILRDMEAFCAEQGDVPVILKRSGTASTQAISDGRLLMQFYLGIAYADGTIVQSDMQTGLRWLERAARGGLLYAQLTLGHLFEDGDAVKADRSQAYIWFSMAAAQDVPAATEAVKRLSAAMSPDEVEAAKARIPAPP